MNWNKGFSASYYIAIVDPITWEDIDKINLTGGSINRFCTELRNSASIDCINFDGSREKWIRIYLDAQQGHSAEHVALFTGLTASPNKSINGELISNQVDCYSVLKPCQDVLLPRGWYAPAGVPGTTVLNELLEATPAPVVASEEGPKLKEYIVAESGENNLSMIDKVLMAMDWRLTIAGDGTIIIGPKATEPVYYYDPLENDAVEPEIDITFDWYSCPNVFRATSGDESEEARDDSNESGLSTVQRGREVWREETSCKLNAGETLLDYAKRRLKELQRVQLTAKYQRRYHPDINASDLIRLHYPKQDLEGVFFIDSQTINLGYGAQTSEEVVLYE